MTTPENPETTTEQPQQPATKIVIVSGQEFSVDIKTKNEEIRQQLTAMGFADVASATIQTGKKTIDGVEYETVEFVKKAGTKGMDGAELVALLSKVPRAPFQGAEISGTARDLLQRLVDETLTYGEAVGDAADELRAALDAVGAGVRVKTQGGELCAHLDRLPAVPAPDLCAW